MSSQAFISFTWQSLPLNRAAAEATASAASIDPFIHSHTNTFIHPTPKQKHIHYITHNITATQFHSMLSLSPCIPFPRQWMTVLGRRPNSEVTVDDLNIETSTAFPSTLRVFLEDALKRDSDTDRKKGREQDHFTESCPFHSFFWRNKLICKQHHFFNCTSVG